MILTADYRIVPLFTEVDNSIPLRVIHIFPTLSLLKTMVANSLASTSQFSS